MAGQPFLLSLRELRRTQGACRQFRIDSDFPEPIETGLACLPAHRTISVAGTVESVGEGVLVTAEMTTALDAQCSRCLVPFDSPVNADFQELFVYPSRESEYDSQEVGQIVDEAIDLGELVRDTIILQAPMVGLCRPGCAGLCEQCGADLNTDPNHGHASAIDSRWLGLAQWGKMP